MAAPSSRQRATRLLKDLRCVFGLRLRPEGASVCTVPGLVFWSANGGGEFICGTTGTSILGGGGAGGAVGNGITGCVPGGPTICALATQIPALARDIPIKTTNENFRMAIIS